MDVQVDPIVSGCRATISANWSNHMSLLGANLDKVAEVANELSKDVITSSAPLFFDWSAKEKTMPGR